MMINGDDGTTNELQEIILFSARHGDEAMVRDLLHAKKEGRISLDISCKGKTKSNQGWTPLHLASYFGHRCVVELLLEHGGDVNACNDAGDTPLHKAAFTGREDLVILLLQHDADVNVINGEGLTPRGVALNEDIHKLLEAAEQTEARKREERLLAAAREGDVDTLNQLLKDKRLTNINCVDAQGNSCLHCASYRGHKEAAVLLLQNGVDTTIRNTRGQTALELARDLQMRQVLGVKPVKTLQKSAARFEGQLLKRSRFLGWKPVWAVLERGVLSYFNSRADACSGVKRKDFKYLDEARVVLLPSDAATFVVHFSDGTVHRLSVLNCGEIGQVGRQKWINAVQEHVAYSTHYIQQGSYLCDSDEEDNDIKPLGSMQDALQTSAAHYQVLQTQLADASSDIQALQAKDVTTVDGTISAAFRRFQSLSDTAANMVSSLGHCLTLFQQQEEVRHLQLRQEQEKCRVLEESLRVLAKEHHELEQSVASHLSSPLVSPLPNHKPPRFYETSDDEFYDAFEDTDSDSDTLVTAISPTSDSDTLVSFPSPTGSVSSSGTVVSSGGHVYRCPIGDRPIRPRRQRHRRTYQGRTSLPVPMFSRNDFSLWSVLKQCIGKELSKITMPVIFNEPLSFLQRIAEYMEYGHLLKRAGEEPDPLIRMQYVTAFAVSSLASNWERLGKPFNPLLGETFELERDGYRLICEQVSHHPPVSAFHCESEDYIFHGSIYPKLKFWGKSVEIQPKGTITVELPKWGEAYTWSNVNCCVHNIIVGKLWMEQYGTMEMVNHKSGCRTVMTFKPAGWFSKDLHRVEGFLTDKQKKKLSFLYGKWTEFLRVTTMDSYDDYVKENSHKFKRSDGDSKSKGNTPSGSPSHTPKKVLAKLNSLKVSTFRSLDIDSSNSQIDDGPPELPEGDYPKCDSTYSIDIPNSITLWEADPRPENCADYYQFTLFAMSLNEMEEGMEKWICRTDCRLRPDIRKLEAGDIDGAAAEKTRLEEKQRDARKSRKSKKTNDWSPRWFCHGQNPHTKQDDWLYSGAYWDRNFTDIPDIF